MFWLFFPYFSKKKNGKYFQITFEFSIFFHDFFERTGMISSFQKVQKHQNPFSSSETAPHSVHRPPPGEPFSNNPLHI